MSNQRFSPWKLIIAGLAMFAFVLTLSSLPAFGQTNVGSGSIQGTITDPSGAVVPGAKITITNTSTKQVINQTTNGSGVFNSGSLVPGQYSVESTAAGFKTSKKVVLVQVGVTTNGNTQLGVGEQSQLIEVTADQAAVDTTQATVQGVLTPEQIETLPVDGRNFLNLAQLEPGVQLQDGQTFDPTKAGYSSVSFNGVNGRTARIELDGVDVSDETVGTSTLNISSGSIQEFQVSRSSLDLSTELTSSGSINVETKSGTNSYHGELFGLFRDRRAGFANSPGGLDNPFQRNQYGGNFGGAIIKDKLFFFANSERIKQDQLQPQNFPAPFTSFNGGFNSPFRDTYSVGRLDYQAPKGVHMFYRFGYEVNKSEANFGFGYAIFANRDNTPAHAAGVDFNTGSFTHSIRFGYEKFHNLIGDGTSGLSGLQNPFPSININVADIGLETGPNLLAPQQTYQSNHQIKYDGSKVWGNHILRFGTSFNRINGGGFASFFGLAPQVITSFAGNGLSPTDTNLGDFPIALMVLGNGQGFFTEKPAFNAPAGGQEDNRFSIYGGDTWKVRPNLTLTYGLRWLRDTGRSDADLTPIPCSAIDPSIVAAGAAPCTGSAPLFNSLQPGLGARVNQPNANFGPQVGLAWDPAKNGKTVFRAGIGLYYENSIFNNTLFDRPAKLTQGLFFNTAVLCGGVNSINFPNAGGPPTKVTSFNGQNISDICNGTIGSEAANLAGIQQAYQAAVKAAGAAANPSFVGSNLALTSGQGLSAYAPDYKPTRSVQMNVGVQHELWKGGIITADYIRNIGEHFPLTIDVNHVGDARFLNKGAAVSAIAATTAAFSCAGGSSAAAIDCAIAAGATISDFAGNGLDSGNVFLGGFPAAVAGAPQQAAFGGINPLWGQALFNFPIGRSVYNGLQLNFRQQRESPFPFVKTANFEASYTYSRFTSDGGNDQNFSAVAFDYANPSAFHGPTALDRTQQLSFGGTFDMKYGPRLSLISHFYSAPPSSIFVGSATLSNSVAGEIFRSDFTGDGTVQDILPGTNVGAFGRGVSASGLASTVNSYNSNQAGTLTPAGQALVSAGLFTQAELTSLGAVKPTVNVPSTNQLGNGILRTFDFKLSYPIKITERIQLEPSVAFFNLFNFANFGNYVGSAEDLVPVSAGPPSPGTISGTSTTAQRDALRLGNGSGTFAQGSPRETEFGLFLRF